VQKDFISTYKTTIKAPPVKVWEALTNPAIVKEYFFGSNLETDWIVGHPIFFKGEYDGKAYQDKGVILEVVPHKKIGFSYLSDWSGMPDIPENYLHVTYELKPLEQGTRLIITQTNYDEERSKHSKESWATVIDGLKKIVET
jgi:uncharacterized protein YndB with AHSA1/START domain